MIAGGAAQHQQDVAAIVMALVLGIGFLAAMVGICGPLVWDDIRGWRERRAIRNDPRRGLEREKILP